MNLLEETRNSIEAFKHSVDDIIFIGSDCGEYECDWEAFKLLANYEYDDDFGVTKVLTDLTIIFKDGSRLERAEYDGSEWWRILPIMQRPKKTGRHMKSLFSSNYLSSFKEKIFG